MHIKIFDCDIFIDSHVMYITDGKSESGMNYLGNNPIPPNSIKETVEYYFMPELAFKKYAIKTSFGPNVIT